MQTTTGAIALGCAAGLILSVVTMGLVLWTDDALNWIAEVFFRWL